MPTAAVCRRTRSVVLVAVAWVSAGPAAAQSVEKVRQWEVARAIPVSIIDLGAAAPNQRSRHALRMRFDSATHAMRTLGVAAQDCSSLVRTSTRLRADEPGGSERLQVSISFAVSCRFF